MSGICPLCRRASNLDFHHWDYDEDIGIKLCRECHDDIHDGLRQSHQQNKAKFHGYSDWIQRAVENLIEKDIAFLPTDEFNIQEQPWAEYRHRLKERYNLPDGTVPKGSVGHFKYVKHDPNLKQGKPSRWGYSCGGGSE